MIELQRNFLSGVMNKDLDPHFLPDGTYQDAYNIIVGDSDGAFVSEEGSHNGVAQNYLGNILKGVDLELINATCIGSISYQTDNLIYWLVASDTLDAIYEYNENQDIITPVLLASKLVGGTSLLNFNKEYPVTGINYINGLLFWTDNYNPPRRININRAKNYGLNGFTEKDISVILAPPLSSPGVSLYNSGDSNNLENKFLYFSYRYKYIDNEYSALSPFSPVAFFPKQYAYDYGVSENISMVNFYNSASISFNSGSSNVKEVQLVFRDTLSTNTYVIDNLIKSSNNYTDDTEYTYQFKNNKVYTILDQAQVNRLFDNVPIKAKSQELIGSRLIYGNYTQFFNLTTCDYDLINPVFTLSLTTENIVGSNPKPTFKSNRDYEIGIVYLDDYGRTTTVITPTENTNTIYIPPSNATKANNIKVTIGADYAPPCFATHYRFMIKQNKQEYYNVFPLLYFQEGQFKWFLVNQADIDKVTVGSYLYLKSSTTNTNTQYKVLDVQTKQANFLNTPNITQPAGVYFKLKIDNTILPSVTYYTDSNGSATEATYQPVENKFDVAEKAIFYGKGLNDMITGNSNIYSGGNDIRFYVEIDSESSVNTFKYYATYNGTYKTLVSENVSITAGLDQTLTYSGQSCSIKFTSNTGHTLGDYWVVNCRSTAGKNIFGGEIEQFQPAKPAVFFPFADWSPSVSNDEDRPIKAGGLLVFKYKETNNADTWITQSFISSKDYINIEEWFVEDYAYQKWIQFNSTGQSIGPLEVCFRRGIVTYTNPDVISQGSSISSTTLSYPVYMYFHTSQGSGSGNPSVDTVFTLQQSNSPVLFETVPTDTNQDVYYELSKTYPIINGNHCVIDTAVDQDQDIATNTPGIINLNKFDFNSDFNAFSFGNGIESFRIRDDWNAATMQFSPRANSTIEGYEQQNVVQALTYSGVYTQTSAINRLNEFNLSLGNFKYLDRFFGSIQKLYSRDTDLVVFQENKVSKVLYGKNLLSDSVGGGTIASIPEVLGTQISYEGEYGISLNPESFAVWGNDLYFTDARRGAVMALQPNGLFEISSQGMKNWFKANLDPNTIKLGMFDPYFEHYTLAVDNTRKIKTCYLTANPDPVLFNGSNQTKSIYIDSNSEWHIIVPTNTYLDFSQVYGSGSQMVYITAEENLGAPRSLDITIESCANDVVITIDQETKQFDWYEITDCSTSLASYSEQYDQGTFALNDRVTNGEDTYTITDILNTNPGGILLPITSTGQTGCPSAGPTTYYELSECGGTGYAFTAIVPDGVGQRFVLPSVSPVFYTYTGGSVSQLTPPPAYNGSIQKTLLYGCP